MDIIFQRKAEIDPEVSLSLEKNAAFAGIAGGAVLGGLMTGLTAIWCKKTASCTPADIPGFSFLFSCSVILLTAAIYKYQKNTKIYDSQRDNADLEKRRVNYLLRKIIERQEERTEQSTQTELRFFPPIANQVVKKTNEKSTPIPLKVKSTPIPLKVIDEVDEVDEGSIPNRPR